MYSCSNGLSVCLSVHYGGFALVVTTDNFETKFSEAASSSLPKSCGVRLKRTAVHFSDSFSNNYSCEPSHSGKVDLFQFE